MKSSLALLVAALVASTAVAEIAAADGGPAPGVTIGWDGVRLPHGAVRYVAVASGPRTVVEAVRVRDGRIVNYTNLKGGFGVPSVAWDGSADGLARDGRTLVLSSFAWQIDPTTVTQFAVLRTRSLRVIRTIELRGLWSFDAISPDGSLVYAIEYRALRSDGTPVYRVRVIDVASGRPRPGAVVDRREPDEQMLGSPATRATTHDGRWAYTLYARPNGTAFVHALDTVNASARCIDLPWRGVAQATWNVRMSVAAGAPSLRLTQRGVGLLATVDRRSFEVRSLRRPVVIR